MSAVHVTADTAAKPGHKLQPSKMWSAAVLMLLLPPLVYYLWICATAHDGALFLPRSTEEFQSLLEQVPAPTAESVLIVIGWLLLQAVLQIAAPGKLQQGTPLADGTRLIYKMNGWFSFCFTLLVLLVIVALGWVRPAILYDQFGPLLTTVNIFAFAFSLFLYLHGKLSPNPEEATGGFAQKKVSGTFKGAKLQQFVWLESSRHLFLGKAAAVLNDYFLGTRLNPRIGPLDFKFFCESRPGLIAWVVINFSLAAKQYELHGKVTMPMMLVLAFQFLYIADYFWHEEAILTTWDIKHERFGWMLCWGDLVWVPFTYTLQALYLVNHPHELPVWGIVVLVLLNLLGYAIFRGANIQKHRFRKNPETLVWRRKPEYITTGQGSRLLTSGWWGMARHANYLGDLLMALAWCLPCLFEHPLPYFYFVYFLVLLIHRERRDHAQCLAKYGTDWEKYCAMVRWRIVPGIY